MRSHLADRSLWLQRIVERQLRKWEISAKQEREDPSERPFLHDFIAISREFGSGGAKLALQLSERLGWKVYDRELLELMSGDETARRHVYSTLDERQSSWIDGLLVLCAPETLSMREDYLRALSRTVLTIAHHEPAIFVGRGAHLVLPPDVGLRVRVTARLEDRVAKRAQEQGVSEKEARREVEQLEAQRQGFLKKQFGVDGSLPEHYELTVNMSRLSQEQACEIVLTALRLKAREPVPE